jgi:type IV secretory pathway VirJ component
MPSIWSKIFAILMMLAASNFAQGAADGAATGTASGAATGDHELANSALPESFDSHGFHQVRLFQPQKSVAKGVVIFFRPAWLGNESFDVARRLANEGNLVIHLAADKFKVPTTKDRRQCTNFSDCLVALSAFAQRKSKFIENILPVVFSVGEAGTFAEKAWREAPHSAFASIISVDYCPQTQISRFQIERTHWTILESPGHPKSCTALSSSFLTSMNVERASIKSNPHYRTGPMIRWVQQRLASVNKLNLRIPAMVKNENVEDLQTVVTVPNTNEKYDAFVIVYSGDGGWAEFTDELAAGFNNIKLPVVGINSMRYFWKAKTPDQGAKDLERIIRFYSLKWGAKKVHLLGFSFGAGVLPFFVRRLPESVQKQVGKIVLLAPYRKADFEFFLTDWFFDDDRGLDVLPEVKKLSIQPLCVYPSDEKLVSLCTQDSTAPLKSVELPGDHHFGNEIDKVVKAVFPEEKI